MSLRRLRRLRGGLTAEQKSASGIVDHVVGEAREALRKPKGGETDRPSRKRGSKARTRRSETDSAADGSVFLGNGDGTLQTRTHYPTGRMGPLVARDLNRDRKPDLAVVHGQTGTVSILLNSVDEPFFTLSVATGGQGRGRVMAVPGGTRCTGSCERRNRAGDGKAGPIPCVLRSPYARGLAQQGHSVVSAH